MTLGRFLLSFWGNEYDLANISGIWYTNMVKQSDTTIKERIGL